MPRFGGDSAMSVGSPFTHLRVVLFYKLLMPFQKWSRGHRMRRLMSLVPLTEGMEVLDLGGLPPIWAYVPRPSLNITLLNLEYDAPAIVRDGVGGKPVGPSGPDRYQVEAHRFQYLVGDACSGTTFQDLSFQLVFSNSVIEHVGGADRRAAFAQEVKRLGKSYWVQTPSKWFPIEAHCGMPFWWFYPAQARAWLIAKWRKKTPAFAEMVEGTDIISKAEMRKLFPKATILVERVLGVPKSYVAYYSQPSGSTSA
jgi:hypothetical protein